MVPPAGIEPATQEFSVPRSTNWATEAHDKAHFINTKDALSTILLNKHLQMRSSFIISYNSHRFWKQIAVCAFFTRYSCGSCAESHRASPVPKTGVPYETTLLRGCCLYLFKNKMPFLPYEAFHSVRGCLQRTAAPKGQMICNDCCRHL